MRSHYCCAPGCDGQSNQMSLCDRCLAKLPDEIRARLVATTRRAERFTVLGEAVRALSSPGDTTT
jgi:hypothetical protein